MILGFFETRSANRELTMEEIIKKRRLIKASMSALVLSVYTFATAIAQEPADKLVWTPDEITSQQAPRVHEVDEESFKCAEELLPSIDILGRGSDYPNFLVTDIHQELLRQDDDTEILNIKCSAEPEIEGMFAQVEVEGELQSALEQLTVKFPVEMLIDTGTTVWIMHIKQIYQVSGLSQNNPQLVQTFEVIKTLNEDGSPLQGKEIEIISSNLPAPPAQP